MTTKPLRVPEASIERYIVDLLTLDGWYCEHVELQWSEKKRKSVGKKGMADLRCTRYGYLGAWHSEVEADVALSEVLHIECKAADGAYAADQIEWAADMRRRGALVIQLGIDCEATVEGFKHFYDASGLCRRRLK